MKILDVEQGTYPWIAARLGIVTASDFKQVITPSKGELSESKKTLIPQLLGERLMLSPIDETESRWMRRGRDQEPDSIDWYEFVRGVTVRRVGFCIADDESYGCSPDGLVGEDGGIEVKVRSMKNHLHAMVYGIPQKERPQVMGNMLVTGRAWWDVLYYNSALPPVVERWERDESYIATMRAAIAAMNAELEAICEKFGVRPDWRARRDAKVEAWRKLREQPLDPDLSDEKRKEWVLERQRAKSAEMQKAAFEGGTVR